MREILFFIGICVFTNICFTQNLVLSNDHLVDIKKACTLIKVKEANIRSIKYDVEIELWKGDSTKIISQGKSIVRLAHEHGFYVEKCGIIPWINGENKFSFQKTIAAFDGQVSRVETHQLGVEINDIDIVTKTHAKQIEKIIGEGSISKGEKESVTAVNWRGIPECIGYMYPYVGIWNEINIPKDYPPISLAQTLNLLISQQISVQITEDKNGVWHIVYPFMFSEDLNEHLYIRIDYDPGKGIAGVIKSVQIGTKNIIENHEIEPKISFFLININDYYVPEKVKILYDYDANGESHIYQHIYFKNIQINIPLSELDFQVNWQKGTNVYDNVAKKFYVITGDPIDEAESVRAFKNIHGLNRNAIGENNSRIIIYRIILGILGFSLISYGIYRRFIRNKK